MHFFRSIRGHLASVNFRKSHFVASAGLSSSQIRRMEHSLEMSSTSLPIKYLGVNLHKGQNMLRYCASLLARFDVKLNAWHKRFLSSAGCLVLIRHALSSIPLHVVAVSALPKSVITAIHRRISIFFQGSSGGQSRHHWVSRQSLFQPVEVGGLGIRHIHWLQEAYSYRLWWQYHSQDGLWQDYMRNKYGRRHDYQPRLTDSQTWKRIYLVHSQCASASMTVARGIRWTPAT